MTEDPRSAIRPSFYRDFTSKVTEIVEEKIPDENQQALAYITHYKGWQLLKDYKVKLEEYLDTLVAEAMAKGLSMNELGERTMVKELAKFVLDSFVKKAEDARRSTE